MKALKLFYLCCRDAPWRLSVSVILPDIICLCKSPPPSVCVSSRRSQLRQPGDDPARLRVLHRHPGLGALLPVLQLPGGAALVALQQHMEHGSVKTGNQKPALQFEAAV